MSAIESLAAPIPPAPPTTPTEATLEAIAETLDALRVELAELRGDINVIASAAGEAMAMVQGKGLLGLLGAR